MEKIIEIEKLRGRENYHHWKFAAEHALKLQNYWKSVLGTEEDEHVREKATSRIVLYISANLFVHIQDCTSADAIWNKLKTLYDDSGLSRRCGLLKKLTTTQLTKCESISDYIDTITDTAQKLNQIGMQVNDEWVGSLLLSGLPDHFAPMIMAIESSGIKITGDAIKTKLLQDFSTYNTIGGTHTETALFGKHKVKNQNGGRYKVKKKLICYNCNKEGHFAKNCTKHVANYALGINCSTNDDWLIDSGATAHLSKNKDFFYNLNLTNEQTVTVANGTQLKVMGKGDIITRIKVNNEFNEIKLRNVLYVPDVCANLLSVSQLTSQGFEVKFVKNICQITKGSEFNIIAKNIRGMFRIVTDMQQKNVFLTSDKELQHKRQGHIGDNKIKCISCIQGKHARGHFKYSNSKTTDILELIHTDVCGPMEENSFGGGSYFLIFLDDFSNKLFVYILKKKSEVPEIFNKFKNMVENQTNKKIKILRSDNGLEFCNKQIQNICDQNGIIHQTTAPYTPQQNGKAERMNRTIVEKARTMIMDANLQKIYWAEAVNTATYLLNRTTTKKLESKTPEEVWSGKKPNLSYLKVFGCIAMVLKPKELRQKWDAKSIKCIMIGYCENSKAYRLYDPINNKMHVSRNVIFIEKQMYYLNTNEICNKQHNENTEVVKIHLDENNSINEENENLVEIDINENLNTEENSNFNEDGSSSFVESDAEYQSLDETISNQDVLVRRSTRKRQLKNMDDYVTYMAYEDIEDPSDYQEAMNDSDREKWLEAIKNEHDSLIENNTWKITNLPEGKRALTTKWVFKKKYNENGKIARYKARLVARGCSQRDGIDYSETYSPVMRYNSLRYLLSIALHMKLKIHQLDVCTAFLQGNLNEEIYLKVPEGVDIPKEKVLKLNRPIYGLKQSSRMWNLKLSESLKELGMHQLKTDQCIYIKNTGDSLLILVIYVDDILIFWNNEKNKNSLIKNLSFIFKLKELGEAKSFLGLQLNYNFEKNLSIDQSNYIEKMLKRFGMNNCNPVSTPMEINIKLSQQQCPKTEKEKNEMVKYPYQSLIGSLLFAAQLTRPDISYAVNFLSRFNNNPGIQHWNAAKRVLRYLKGTIDHKLTFEKIADPDIVGYCDADYANDTDERKSVSGYVFMKQGAAISWGSKKQNTTALSTCEAEYMAMGVAVQEALWLRSLETEIFGKEPAATKIYCDNHGAIKLALNESYHARTKHIDVRHHFIRNSITNANINIQAINTDEMTADVLTKPHTRNKVIFFNESMGIKN